MSGEGWWEGVEQRMAAYQKGDPANLPGAVFAVETAAEGRLQGKVGAGWETDAICAIASMSKPFVATALLLALEERDLLDIERPVYELPGMELYAGNEAKRQIKVRHLLQHTSGLPAFQPITADARTTDSAGADSISSEAGQTHSGKTVPWKGSPGLTNEFIPVQGDWCPTRELSLDQVSEYVMKTTSPTFQPGTNSCYSTYAFTVVGRLIEQLSGESMNRYVRRRLFEPLGMKDAFFVAQESGDERVDRWQGEGVTEEQRQRVPEVALITQDGEMPPEVAAGPDGKWDRLRRGWRYVFPEGGMYATAGDLLNYLGMLRDGGKREGREVVSKQVVDLLVKDQGFGHTMGFAYANNSKRHGAGTQTLMHLGSFNTFFWFESRPENQLIGVFMAQRLTYASKEVDGREVIFKCFAPAVESHVFAKRVSPAL